MTASTEDDRLARIETKLDGLATNVDGLNTRVDGLTVQVNSLTVDVEKFNDKFDNYQKATQWVVQLAFTLIASATITVIISTVL